MANTATFVKIDSTTQGTRTGTNDTALSGTVTFSAGTSVVGVGTDFLTSITPFLTQGVVVGNPADSPKQWFLVASVADDTHLTLKHAYSGTTGSGITAHKGSVVYGSEGGDNVSDSEAFYPSYLTVTPTNRNTQITGAGSSPVCMRFGDGLREGNVYFSNTPGSDLILNLAITGGLQHQFAIYFQDSTDRTGQTIAILDGTDHTTVLDAARAMPGNMTSAPAWFVYNIGGTVDVVLHRGNYTTYQCIAFDPVAGGATREIKMAGWPGGYVGRSGGFAG